MSDDSLALVPYRPMDSWEALLEKHDERRVTSLESPVLACEKPWLFTVEVKSEDEGMWPKDTVVLRVDLENGPGEIYVIDAKSTGPRQLHVDGKGPDQASTSCDVDGWDVTAKPKATLPADDGQTLVVKIQARWIKLRVRRHDRDEVVPGITLDLTVPEGVTAKPVTEEATLLVDRGFTKLGPVTLKEMVSAEGVWEYVP
jgi:hypothetical protein